MRRALLVTAMPRRDGARARRTGCFFGSTCTDDDTCAPTDARHGTPSSRRATTSTAGRSTTSDRPEQLDGGTGGSMPAGCDPTTIKGAVADTCGVFVSSSKGNDGTGKGTKEQPYQTIGKALAKAGGKPVYACGEGFTEAVTVSAGVTIYGALGCSGQWFYDAANKTTLTAPADAVPLTLASTAGGTTIHDFAITAADAMMAGGSSIAVLADGVATSFVRVDITSGKGQDGAAGTTPTTDIGTTIRRT